MNILPALADIAAPQHLRTFDLVIIALYLAGITLFGLRFRKRSSGAPGDKSLKTYFLANNTIPWWAIALSVVSAETSTLTIISIPGIAFGGDFGFLQIALGYMIGRIVVALLFLPRYFAGEMLTAYQLIDRRFGPTLHKVTAGLFLLTRAAAEGVRVFAISIVVGIAIGTKDVLSIAIISVLTLLYTFEGGMAAVIWTDVVQMIIYVGGTLVAILTLGSHVHGGWHEIHTVAAAAGKFHWLNFSLNLTQSYTFWAGVLGGTFLTMASHGTDQLMVQRLLAARSLRQSQAALLGSGLVIFAQFWMFLLIGAGLYVFYGQHPGTLPAGLGADRLFPTFIVHEMPLGIAGLLIAAILAAAMSNLSAALNSLSSTTVVDFYVTLRPNTTDNQRATLAKSSTVFWAFILFSIAVGTAAVGGKGHVVEIALSIAAVAYGCLLGVFLLGTLTKFATQAGTSIGMVCGFVLNLWLWQGKFPVHLGPFTIPHIAFTWYVLIGAAATFLIGALASMIFRTKPRASTIAASLLLLFLLSSPQGICFSQQPAAPQQPDFTPVSHLMNDAIAAHKLPGAVVLIGHNGKIVFNQTYGSRKLANEPGLSSEMAGQPSPSEPMTEDTIFDMASLTKVLATTTSVMQFYDAGKLDLDIPLDHYLPDFNPNHDPTRTKVTPRLLLTHTSGEAPDIDLKDAWGLAAPDRAEGLQRALTTPLMAAPGTVFRYSDINFLLLGALVEKLSGQREDDYVAEHVFAPLGMAETGYHPFDRTCGPIEHIGSNSVTHYNPKLGRILVKCRANTWSPANDRIAPTAHDNEGNATTNPDFDHLLRGTVHDPTTRRMGGVAGHAGVFSTAHDTSLFAQALLDKLLHNTGPFPLKQSTLRLMTTPQQPAGLETATILTRDPNAPTPTLLATKGQPAHGLGWDINTAYARPRGALFPTAAPSTPSSPTPSFGHTGFTGTSLWIDPNTDTYVILLANAIHPRGNPPISALRGEVATAAAQALRTNSNLKISNLESVTQPTLTGIDVLTSTHFTALAPYQHLGLLTNQSGLDSQGRRTVDLLATTGKLTRLFSPEHGLFGAQDDTKISAETDTATHLPVFSLYGPKPSDKHPSHDQLKDLDAVVIDLQDVGTHFFTYETVMGYFLEAAADEQTTYHHKLTIVLLDRPNPVGGETVQGPVSDPGIHTYINYTSLPARHGLTLGELAQYDNRTLHAPLQVIALQNWTRAEYFDQTGLPWTNPSPNLHTLTATTLYHGMAFLEMTNVSVGRGTDKPFEQFGATWLDATKLAATLNARSIPGVHFTATTMAVAEDKNHYPFHGQTIPAIHIDLTDRSALDSPELGIELLTALYTAYPQFTYLKAAAIIANPSTMDALTRGDDPRTIASSWQPALDAFKAARKPFLLY